MLVTQPPMQQLEARESKPRRGESETAPHAHQAGTVRICDHDITLTDMVDTTLVLAHKLAMNQCDCCKVIIFTLKREVSVALLLRCGRI